MKGPRHFIFSLLISVLIGFLHVEAAGNGIINTSTADFDMAVKAPVVSTKVSAAVARHMETIRQGFTSKNFKTSGFGNELVVLVTIPASQLFSPNGSELTYDRSRPLEYFHYALKHPEYYRLVVAVHADDTGDDDYSLGLTTKRVSAIKQVFDALVENDDVRPNVSYFALGNKRYLNSNSTMNERAANRRVEIYIIPTAKVIDNIMAR